MPQSADIPVTKQLMHYSLRSNNKYVDIHVYILSYLIIYLENKFMGFLSSLDFHPPSVLTLIQNKKKNM